MWIEAPLASYRQVDVGHIVVVSDADLVGEDVGRHVLARFVGDADVDVVGECFEQLLCEDANAGRRRVRKQDRSDPSGRKHRDRQSGLAGAVHIDAIGRPEPQHQVDVVDDVITVQMGEEDRTHGAATFRLAFGMHRDTRPPGLTMHPFATVDDVGDVADNDRVRVAGSCRLGIRRTRRSQQDETILGIGPQRLARRPRRYGRRGASSPAKNI